LQIPPESPCIYLHFCKHYVEKIKGYYKQINSTYFIFMKQNTLLIYRHTLYFVDLGSYFRAQKIILINIVLGFVYFLKNLRKMSVNGTRLFHIEFVIQNPLIFRQLINLFDK
jgi:hypothetical protein